jgi:glutamate-1-semialdehyde aminotransferase
MIRQYAERVACVISIPNDFTEDPSGTFIRLLRSLTAEYGILLILDEVLTGFRLARGGAQEFYGVDADLASYAKALANGYPLSVYCGKRQYMSQLNSFKITTTYAGETLSLAAASATLSIMERENVHEHIWGMGKRLMEGFDVIARECGVEGRAAGLAPAPYLKFISADPTFHGRLEYLWHRELYREGIFANYRWLISYSHKASDIDETLEKARRALKRALDAEQKEGKTVQPFWW